uniref:Heat shock protein 12A n=1 Tax=Poecilia formosa TaxID=48698 RepID=A0A096LUE2_POEFO
NDKKMTALKVFSESLRFLKDDALKTINANKAGLPFAASDFTWVLTVPANCDESAKQFMREAAIQAGIITEGDDKKLVITLEPEAASVWCKKLPADGFITQNHIAKSLDQTPGTQYVIADCGGGTIDITVHKVLKGGALKELHKASGNDLRGRTVDRKFKKFLREIFFHGVWDEYEEKYPSEVQKMMYTFTNLKQVDEDVEIQCPDSLGELAEKKKDIEKFFESTEGASWDEGSIIISREKLITFFDEILQGITKSLREILNKNLNIGFILTVGGLAESQIVRELINEQFSEYKILCPARPQEAILRGAVLYPCVNIIVTFQLFQFMKGCLVGLRFAKCSFNSNPSWIFFNLKRPWKKHLPIAFVLQHTKLYSNYLAKYSCFPFPGFATDLLFCNYLRKRSLEELCFTHVMIRGVEEVISLKVLLHYTKRNKEHKVELKVKFGSTEMTATAADHKTKELIKTAYIFDTATLYSYKNNLWVK